jgi:hypothetical protein
VLRINTYVTTIAEAERAGVEDCCEATLAIANNNELIHFAGEAEFVDCFVEVIFCLVRLAVVDVEVGVVFDGVGCRGFRHCTLRGFVYDFILNFSAGK